MICLGPKSGRFGIEDFDLVAIGVSANAPFLYIAKGIEALCGNAYPT